MRTFGVEEEFLLIDQKTRQPVPLGEVIVARHGGEANGFATDPWQGSGHVLTMELHQEQLEVSGPPVLSFAEQETAIRKGRRLADEAARLCGAQVVALASPVTQFVPHIISDARSQRIGRAFGLMAQEQLSCGFHVHVEVSSREEGIHIIDRIRPWLPVLLAMSSNSPFWYGRDSEFASYRHLSWGRWPTARVMDPFGSLAEYDDRAEALVRCGAALDKKMLYYPARLCEEFPTIEIRVMDVCLDARHAAALATLVRALVDMAARRWSLGIPPPYLSCAELGAWMWRAARRGLCGCLVDPVSGELRAAEEVVRQLLAETDQSLTESGDKAAVVEVVELILEEGTGATRQRGIYAEDENLQDVVDSAARQTHADSPSDATVSAGRAGR